LIGILGRIKEVSRRLPLLLVATLAFGCSEGSGDSTIPTSDGPTTAAPSTTQLTQAPTTTAGSPTSTTDAAYLPEGELTIEAFPVPPGSRPHDVAPAVDGGVWYTAQGTGELGRLDPESGETFHVGLGAGSRPHGVIVDEEGTPWITDSGLNAIVSVDQSTREVTVFPLPADHPDANLNTASFDGSGVLWFTGQQGVYGSLDPASGEMAVYEAPNGRGPYGITTTPAGSVFYASLAGSHIAAISSDGSAVIVDPPTPDQGARRVWSDSGGSIWVSEWNSGNVSRYTPESADWSTWTLPGDSPAPYAVYVDEADIVWLSDFGANAMVRFDPVSQGFTSLLLPHDPGEVRQILGRPGEVWAGESAADHLILIRTR
jgi:virginiamycin B lyase